MEKSFLPSKKFISRLVAILSVIVIFFSIRYIISYFRNTPKEMTAQKVLVKDIILRDANGNGIADWEESLWGLNPNKDGEANKEFILNKKQELAQKTGSVSSGGASDGAITENDQFSRDFFALIMSLEQTGELNQQTMNSISEMIGQKIEIVPIDDIYTAKSLIIEDNSETAKADYYNNFKKLVDKYASADIGSELTLIAQGLANGDLQSLAVVSSIALAYRSFGAELIKIPVPKDLTIYHLDLANNYEKVGQTIEGLTMILSDPIVGMKSLLSYKKYSDKMLADLQLIQDFLFGNLDGYELLKTEDNLQ